MITIKKKDVEFLEVKITNILTRADIQRLLPIVREYLAESTHPRLLITIEDFGGWNGAATLWEDTKMDIRHIGKFERTAVVADKMWAEWSTRLADPLTSDKIKFFARTEAARARRWLNKRNNA